MRSLPLLVVLAVASAGLATAQDYQNNQTGSSGYYYPPPPGPMISVKLYVEDVDVIAFHGTDVWLVHESTTPRATDHRAEVFLNGHPWIPTFDNGTCPCFSQTFQAGNMIPAVPPDGDYELRVHSSRGVVKIEEQPKLGAGVLRVRIEDPLAGGEHYGFELIQRNAPNYSPPPPPPEDENLKIRLLVDGYATLALKDKSGWVDIHTGVVPVTNEPILYFDGHPITLRFQSTNSSAGIQACPCRSEIFPLPFEAGEEGVPADGVGAIFFWEGRGPVKIIEQPRDGAGTFRLAFDDTRYENAAWYHVVVGGDPAYREQDPEPCTYTDAAGNRYSCAPQQSPCEPLPPEAVNWTEDLRKKWYYEHCYRDTYPPPPACAAPPESQTWTEEQRREFAAKCAYHCAPPPEAQYWPEDRRRAWFDANCRPHTGEGCNPPPDWSTWSDSARHRYVVDKCQYPASCPAPARHLANASEADRDAWMKTNCPHYSDASGSPSDFFRDLASNKTLQEEAKKALQNGTDPNKIVVPGFEPVLALLGLAAMAFIVGRRR